MIYSNISWFKSDPKRLVTQDKYNYIFVEIIWEPAKPASEDKIWFIGIIQFEYNFCREVCEDYIMLGNKKKDII